MRSLVVALVALCAATVAAQQIPPPQGYVTDQAGAIDPPTKAKIEALAQELQQKTGAEIAVLTVRTTEPLDDFTYAMRVADAWKVGKKGEDTGVLVLVAVDDRKVRVVTGYGVEGVLPDGLVGNIQDTEMVPEFRAGRMGEGIWRGVAQMARRIAAERGVTLTGVPAPRAAPPPPPADSVLGDPARHRPGDDRDGAAQQARHPRWARRADHHPRRLRRRPRRRPRRWLRRLRRWRRRLRRVWRRRVRRWRRGTQLVRRRRDQ